MGEKMKPLITAGMLALLASSLAGAAETRVIGSVDTNFKLLGRDDHIEIATFNDEKIPNVSCYISYAKKGGLKGAIGIATDSSDASIHCISNSPVDQALFDKLPQKERVWRKRSDLFFKTMQVVRFKDAQNKALVYLTYSDKLVDGSPKNAITVVPITFK
ncbi:hypothetical protein A4G20_02975 [Pasteurellaceae bacterium RH1A]|nr:hypothetical protein A4G20_02975 [Pasteurellaceae bacterium RH1A]